MTISIRSSKPAAHDHSGGDEIPVVSAGIASSAVTEGKIGALAVTTSVIASGAVTAVKAADALRQTLYIGDETETTSTSITDENLKSFTLIKDPTSGLDLSGLRWQIESKNSTASGTTTWTLLVDTTSTVSTGTMIGTSYVLQTGSTAVSLTTGTHPVDFYMNTTSGGTAYNRLFELYAYT